MTLTFWLTSLVVVLVPGTGVIYTISAALTGGLKKSTWAAAGCTLGIVPHLLASLLGLTVLLNTWAMAFQVLKYLGVAYLLFLAWQMWRDKLLTQVTVVQGKGWSTLRKAFLMNILNPKLTIFFLAFLPQFVDSRGPSPVEQMILLSLCFMGLTLAVFLLYGLSAHLFRERILKNPRVARAMNRTFAGLLAFFGVQLALSDR
jgi:threonine/homoserine/homoserine lactone efflux protein